MPLPELAPTDLAAVARGVVELFGEAVEGVEITYEGPDTLPLIADRDLLRLDPREMIGGEGRVCVLLRSRAKWGLEHLDSYWDDVSLQELVAGEWKTAMSTGE